MAYKNEFGFGFHTPKRSAENAKRIERAIPGRWIDSSWHNDVADSMTLDLANGGHLQVFLPNSQKDDASSELFSNFHFNFYDKDANCLLDEPRTMVYNVRDLKKEIAFYMKDLGFTK